MFKRRKIVALLATCAFVALGVGLANISAKAEQSLSGFEISSVSVRVSEQTHNGYNTSGIRFKTDVGANAKETYKDAVCYTTVTIDDYGVARNVAAQVWRTDGCGWNTVVMGIPESDYATDITAQSFIKVNESTVYATKAVSYSISDAAELVVQDANASAELKAAVEKYIVRENGTTTSYQADLNTMNNGSANASYGTYSSTNGWKATSSAIQQGGSKDTTNTVHKSLYGTDTTVFGVCLNGKSSATGKLVSPTIEEGISKLSFEYGLPFSDTQFGMTISIKANGSVVASKTLEQTDWKNYYKSTFVWELETPITGEFSIEFVNNAKGGLSKNGERVSIWNIVWDNYVENAGSSGGSSGGDQGGDSGDENGGSGTESGGDQSGGSTGGSTSGTGAHSVDSNGKCSVCGEQLITYDNSGTYLANWGTRDETATFLTPYATAFYTGDYTYENLSKLSGGSSQSNAPNSALYSTLKTLMSSKHTTITTYDGTRSLYAYTDCVNNDTSKVSLFYLGTMVSSTWDSGKTYNREHTWPNSKCIVSSTQKNDSADIMMLRPADPSENSSRGNTAYGESSGYYDPNGEGQKIRGDCARMLLYAYTRWGNTSKMWGTDGVMESMSVLLKWMAEDPVDTWELARNDAVQSITGTRNVFVDYPELAWQLFGQSVPAGVSTPSSATACSGGSSTSSVATVQVYFPQLGNTSSGDCALIKVGNTEVLVDAGSSSSSAATIVPYLKQYCTDGVLEYVIATHGDADHIAAFSGTSGIFNNFVCGTIIDFAQTTKTTQTYKDYVTWRDNEVTAGAVHYTALDCWNNANGAKRSYELGTGVTMHILYQKYYEQTTTNENDYSVCMMISQGDNHYLFTGDLESSGEASLVASNDLPQMALYKAGHHGSATSSTATLIDVIQPKVVVSTCVAGDKYGFPTQTFIDNIAKYTDRLYIPSYVSGDTFAMLNGNICVSSTDGKTVQVSCSNNNTLFKDTEWFKSNRTIPSGWAA